MGGSDRVALVTGGNIGIGYETCRGLALSGKFNVVILACRSRERGAEAAAKLRQAVGSASVRFECLRLDLESLDSVDEFVQEFQRSYPVLHGLVCNAGILPMDGQVKLTAEGHERTFAVNHLGHFLLIVHLLPQLIAARHSRVVIVSSMVHQYGRIHFDDLTLSRLQPSARDLYAQSKLANILCAYELQRRYGHHGIRASACHPGVVASDILKESHFIIRLAGPVFMRLIGRSPAQGATGSVMLATEDRFAEGGEYLDQEQRHSSSPLTYDAQTADRLWRRSLDLVDAQRRVAFNYAQAADLSRPYILPPTYRRPWYNAVPWKFVLVILTFAVLFYQLAIFLSDVANKK